MTTPHATEPNAEPPPEELAVTEPPERPREAVDWEAAVLRIAGRAREAGTRLPAPDSPAERLRADAARRQKLAQQRRNIAAALAQVPDQFAEAEPTHPEVRRWVEEVQAGRTRDSLILLGTVGTGKTHQAFGAFRELSRFGLSCQAVTVPAFLDGLRPGRPGTVDYAEVERCDLLLLDDLAAERVTDWTGEVLYRLIDARYSWRRLTIITTNATPADVRERLGDRVASRLAGMGRSIVMTGPDRRSRRPSSET